MVSGEPYPSEDTLDNTTPMPSMGAIDEDQSSSAASKAKQRAGQAASRAADKAQQVAGPALDQAQDTAGQVKEQTQQTAIQVKNQVQQTATSTLESRKDQAAGSLESVAQAVTMLGQQLQNNDQQSLAQYADQAAGRIQQTAQYLRERDVRDLVGEVENFARRQPALFLAGALTLGILSARFLKSSGQQAQRSGSASTLRSSGLGTTGTLGRTGQTGQWTQGQGAPYGVYDPGSTGTTVREVPLE